MQGFVDCSKQYSNRVQKNYNEKTKRDPISYSQKNPGYIEKAYHTCAKHDKVLNFE